MISHHLGLDYALNPGWIAPYVAGLSAGKARARRCQSCAATSFPPLRVCTCGCLEGEWTDLPGTAQILFRTTGLDGDFGLVHFDGATTKTTLRLQAIPATEMRGVIAASGDDLPMLCLTALTEERDG